MSKYESTIVITGGTAGLGVEAASLIAKQSPNKLVVIASRSSNNALAQIKASNVEYIPLDLSKPQNIREFAQKLQSYPAISALLLNAALQFPAEVGFYDSGIERTFAITHVGNTLLFHLLASRLTNDARIIITASGVHYTAKEEKTGMPEPDFTTAADVARPDPKTATKDGRQRYTTAKLANILWMYALERRIRKYNKPWTVNSFDPGLMPGSGLARDYDAVSRFIWFHIFPRITPLVRLIFGTDNIHTTAESGAALARLAVDSNLKNVTGKYFEGLKERPSSLDRGRAGKGRDGEAQV
jgi:NAD(P)-dependent dehydrogenase (short-subunit alcohol dehydrogenase family)